MGETEERAREVCRRKTKGPLALAVGQPRRQGRGRQTIARDASARTAYEQKMWPAVPQRLGGDED
jgi:hypothetical protein